MPCILPDGNITDSAKRILSAARDNSIEEISGEANLPLFRVRSSIRELLDANLIDEKDGRYSTTEEGKNKL